MTEQNNEIPAAGGTPEGGVPHPFTRHAPNVAERRGMENALLEMRHLVGELSYWLSDIDEFGEGRGREASEAARLFARMVDQLTTMCQLLAFSVGQMHEEGDMSTAWILLEQARQQLGFAAVTAATMDGTLAAEDEAATAASLTWFVHRDLLPTPKGAGQLIDFGCGEFVLPDFRPDVALELMPLQFMANAAMRYGTVSSGPGGPMPRPRVERMAYGEYLAIVIDEAMNLLDTRARQADVEELVTRAGGGAEAANLLWQTGIGPWQVLPGSAAEPGAA